ncbi:hypothetical protein Poli38472_008143 [Pythium oligandrum]|uniref:Uncharacterized protein n=1 Tax=Pythium oligandrum TaxID=41045 RepID=A0A8K1CMS0_PYTOL|nr:hypothetical protein Poli38472_008143 [Pythium oligandrum]|eukprot:TMW65501.1 hypothetical protein Poli38472_008143 [Pythium oligandrum]
MCTTRQCVAAVCTVATALYAYPLFDPSHEWGFLLVWDDEQNFIKNTVIHGLTWPNVVEMLTLCKINVYEPLGWLLKAIVYEAVGMDSWMYRIVTLVLHVATAWILAKTAAVLIILANVDVKPSPERFFPGCLLSALVFMVHPMFVEVVAWPSAQPYAMASSLSGLALLSHSRSLRRRLQAIRQLKKPLVAQTASSSYPEAASQLETLVYVCSPSLLSADTWIPAIYYLGAVLSKSVCVLLPAAMVLIDLLVLLPALLDSRLMPHKASLVRLSIRYILHKALVLTILVAFVGTTLYFNEGGMRHDTDLFLLSISERLVKTAIQPARVLTHIVWPAHLSPHYAVRDGDLDLGQNPECTLSLAVLMGFVVWMIRRAQVPVIVASIYFLTMLLPTCGLIQHGAVTLSANRYAYFPVMVFIPFGGYALTSWLELAPTSGQTEDDTEASAPEDHPARKITMPRQNTSVQWRWFAFVSVVSVLLVLSSQHMGNWSNVDVFTQSSLIVSPSDFRMLDVRAQYLMEHSDGCERDQAQCHDLWYQTYLNAPKQTVKAQIFRLKLLLLIEGLDYMCKRALALLHKHPESCLVQNNAGICLMHLQKPYEARLRFEHAVTLSECSKNNVESVRGNLASLEEWEDTRRQTGQRFPFYNGHFLW